MSLNAVFNLYRAEFALSVDLQLPDKGVTAIFGPSGSGKTTLLRAIAGLEKISGGQLSLGPTVWQSDSVFVPPHQRAIGYVFQEPSLFPHMSVQANLSFGMKRVAETRQRISMTDAIELLDISSLLKRQPETLSGGEQQRVAIARTLLVSPELLLMDEPLSSLDNKIKQEVLPYIESLQQELDIPVLYVSHATDEVARLADNLVILRQGEVLASGPIQEMLTRLDLPLSHRNDAESLIQATVGKVDSRYNLTTLESAGHTFTVAGTDLPLAAEVRLRIAAHDVSLTLDKQTGTSIQNIFPVTVAEIAEESPSQSLIKISLGNTPILARVTHKAVHDLKISPGKQLYAQIKSVAVLA